MTRKIKLTGLVAMGVLVIVRLSAQQENATNGTDTFPKPSNLSKPWLDFQATGSNSAANPPGDTQGTFIPPSPGDISSSTQTFTPPPPDGFVLDTSAPTAPVASEMSAKIIGVVLVFFLLAILLTCWIFAKRIMSRSSIQKIIQSVGMLIFVLCGLFPPWLDISYQGHTRVAAYSFILSPPATAPGSYGVKIDLSRLAVEWLCVLAFIAAFWIFILPNGTGKNTTK